MKFSDLSVKRRPAKKPVFRKLFANVRRKQQKVAVSAPMPDADGDVPNLGIARALVVILIIHVIAIGGIFAHSKWFEKDSVIVQEGSAIVPAKQLRDAGEPLPKIDKNDEPYQPKAGETYASIARDKGVSEQALREANNNIEIRPSRILRIPQQAITALEPQELIAARNGSVVLENADAMPNEEAAPAPTPVVMDEIRNAPMVETAAASSGTVFKPRVQRETAASQAAPSTPVKPQAQTSAMNRSYKVKSGDTFWKIAQAHKTTPDAIMKANGISDPRKLKPGMNLKVP
ncbi:LysM peptidoglycan-binding domain-containing protein [Luteolibacter flavescens]|uniref:LysM peptidoglycan-binding domain-containing protein n=1 Tax=Luteolibacter flavescens TaxID=1859460 RepID=A0ABT3FMN6_9BACT|nr:LysM peptidoglycan-binding domain-containing protein [Luteolibacter flavescens]MCW1884837.1 LysM peptidoglycan-binding domain-containing protein [Luteolibacter flavescens]